MAVLELPEIKTREYEDALADYAKRFHELSGGKSSFSESSVSMTLLELLTYIQQRQQKNMNIIGEKALINLAKLYGGEQKRLAPAVCTAAFSGTRRVPAGTKLLCDDMVFETAETCTLSGNKAVYFGRPAENGALEQYRYGDEISFELFGGCDSFVIGFEKGFAAGEQCSLFLCFDKNGRQIPADMSGFDVGTEIEWQYFGTENGKKGWHSVKLIRDETFNCFKSGALIFSVNGAHERSGSLYPLRAVVRKRCFDVLPLFRGMYTDFCKAEQTDTKCCFVSFDKKEFRENAMFFDNVLGESGSARLLVLGENGYSDSETIGAAFDIDRAENGFRLVTSSRAMLSERFSKLSEKSAVLVLVLYEHSYIRDFTCHPSDGSANRQISLNFSGAYPEGVSLLVRENGAFLFWNRTDNLRLCGANERVFEVRDDRVIFGDNIHGRIPPEGEIIIVSLKLTSGKNGNIPAGSFEASGFLAKRLTPSEGGMSWETPDEFFGRALSESQPRTLLSERDFAECAVGCEGLLIKSADVYETADEYGNVRQNSVTVSVHPAVSQPDMKTDHLFWYLTNLKRVMSKYIPITTELIVKFPVYIPVTIKIRARTTDYFSAAEAEIRRCVGRLFDENESPCAEYSDIIRAVGSLGCVSEVCELSLSTTGVHAVKRVDGSISGPAHSRVFIKSIEVRCD